MNETLRRALFSAHLDEVDVAARLEVDPKTVRRWLEGRLPYTRHRWALASLLNLNETDLWPELRPSPVRPAELLAIYPHRSSIPGETWRALFASAEREISILDYSSLFLAEDPVIIRTLVNKACHGVRVRIALADPESVHVAEFSAHEVISDALAIGNAQTSEVREALGFYRSLRQVNGVEIRLHRVVPYQSIYHADNELFCNQHIHGNSADRNPVLHVQRRSSGDLFSTYLSSFNKIWNSPHVRGYF